MLEVKGKNLTQIASRKSLDENERRESLASGKDLVALIFNGNEAGRDSYLVQQTPLGVVAEALNDSNGVLYIPQDVLSEWESKRKVVSVIHGHDFSFAVATGLVSGFAWMVLGDVMSTESPTVLIISAGTLLTYFPMEVVLFRYDQHRWPTPVQRRLLLKNSWDLSVKTAFSVLGWVTGLDCATRWEWNNVATTMLIAASDAVCVGVANIVTASIDGGEKKLTMLWNTLGLMLLVAVTAATWQQMSLLTFTSSSAVKGIVTGAALTAEYYLGKKIPVCVPRATYWLTNLFKTPPSANENKNAGHADTPESVADWVLPISKSRRGNPGK